MGVPKSPETVKPICGVLLREAVLLPTARSLLEELLGPVEAQSPLDEWNWSSYYAAEMGAPLWRCWFSFVELRCPSGLVDWKLATNAIEQSLATDCQRQVNLDPGYIATSKLVLASTKDAPHRIYLSDGIFAEVTLLYERGDFQPQAYTYPDYAAPQAREFFCQVRRRYLQQRRASKA